MGGFFCGWRRKLGVVMLVIACAFAGVWIRSFYVGDVITFANSQWLSFKGGLFWERVTGQLDVDMKFSYGSDANFQDIYQSPEWNDKWRWKCLGFAYGETDGQIASANGTRTTYTSTYYFVPYWSVVIPLTVLSGYLLLGNSHSGSRNKTAVPTSDRALDGG